MPNCLIEMLRLFNAVGLCDLPMMRGLRLSVPVIFVHKSKLILTFNVMCFDPRTLSSSKAYVRLAKSLKKKLV